MYTGDTRDDLRNGYKLEEYTDLTCPHCEEHDNCVCTFAMLVGSDTYEYGMECFNCHAMWNVQYGSLDNAIKYLKARN